MSKKLLNILTLSLTIKMENKKFHVTAPLTIIALVVIIAVGVFLVYAVTQKDSQDNSVATTTQETVAGVPDEISEDIDTPTTSDTQENESAETPSSKLSTFSDDTAGISFKYPSTWSATVSNDDAPANRPGRKIDTIVTLVVDSGDLYSVSIPAPEIGFEAWTFADPVTITAADGKVFNRRNGTRTDDSSGVNKYFYYAFTPNESTDSVMVMGGGSAMPESLISQLDALISTITVQE